MFGCLLQFTNNYFFVITIQLISGYCTILYNTDCFEVFFVHIFIVQWSSFTKSLQTIETQISKYFHRKKQLLLKRSEMITNLLFQLIEKIEEMLNAHFHRKKMIRRMWCNKIKEATSKPIITKQKQNEKRNNFITANSLGKRN